MKKKWLFIKKWKNVFSRQNIDSFPDYYKKAMSKEKFGLLK